MTEIDTADLRAKAEAATPGPRMWSGDAKYHNWRLSTWKRGAGRWTIMDFQRAGMQNAEPRFNVDGWMKGAREFPIFEVCRDARSGSDPRVYRHDVVGIRHPDAEFIAAMSPDVVLALLDEIARLRALVEIPAPTLCPECVQGKHGNCIEQTLNDADEWVPCGCPEHGSNA